MLPSLGQTPICGFCGFLRTSAVSCENLRFSAKNPRFPNALFSRKRQESAKICENLRLDSVSSLKRVLILDSLIRICFFFGGGLSTWNHESHDLSIASLETAACRNAGSGLFTKTFHIRSVTPKTDMHCSGHYNASHDARHVHTGNHKNQETTRYSADPFCKQPPFTHCKFQFFSQNHENHSFHDIVWWHKANKTDRARRRIVVWFFWCVAWFSGEGVQDKGRTSTACTEKDKTQAFPDQNYPALSELREYSQQEAQERVKLPKVESKNGGWFRIANPNRNLLLQTDATLRTRNRTIQIAWLRTTRFSTQNRRFSANRKENIALTEALVPSSSLVGCFQSLRHLPHHNEEVSGPWGVRGLGGNFSQTTPLMMEATSTTISTQQHG